MGISSWNGYDGSICQNRVLQVSRRRFDAKGRRSNLENAINLNDLLDPHSVS